MTTALCSEPLAAVGRCAASDGRASPSLRRPISSRIGAGRTSRRPHAEEALRSTVIDERMAQEEKSMRGGWLDREGWVKAQPAIREAAGTSPMLAKNGVQISLILK